MANFLKTIGLGYKMMWEDLNRIAGFKGPKIMSGVGTGLQMIAGALFARTATKDETQQAIADANKALAEVEASVASEKKPKKALKLMKAHVVKGWKVVKAYKKPIAVTVGGAVLQQGAMGWSTSIGEKAVAGAAAIGAEFAAYRAAVRENEGEEADLKYLTGGKLAKNGKKTVTEGENEEIFEDDDGITIKKDPSVFKLWVSKETCPTVWSDCRDLLIHKLTNIENILQEKLQSCGHITLNDMRREFNKLDPQKMDVGIGGILGIMWDDEKRQKHYFINLHFKEDLDFMEGRSEGVWVIFDCDPDPIIGKIKPKLSQVEV